MAINKPEIPSIELPEDWGGTQTPYTEQQTQEGYPEAIPTVVDGGNLNFEKKGIFKNIKYLRVFADWLRNIPIGKIPVVNKQGQLDYDTPVTDSEVVHRTGDETITGAKTFLGTTIRNKCSLADSTASTISSTEEKGLLILDIKGNRIGNFYGGQLADGNLRTYMCTCRSVNGSVVYQYAQIKQASDGTGVFSINCNSALAPTPPTGDNSTNIATTQWVRDTIKAEAPMPTITYWE